MSSSGTFGRRWVRHSVPMIPSISAQGEVGTQCQAPAFWAGSAALSRSSHVVSSAAGSGRLL